MSIKVSVIMPIYNCEKFLEKNLLELTKQTLEDIEFICVNDASTDNSLNILKAFAQVFPEKFVVIDSKKNRGPGGARNIGISYAKGEYIGFVDSDDFAHKDMFKNLYDEAKSGDYDIVSCGFYMKKENKDYLMYDLKGELTPQEKIYYLNSCYLWNKIFKKSLLDSMSMYFRENVIEEDTDFVAEAIVRANKFSSIPDICYYYNYNENSVTINKKIVLETFYDEMVQLFESLDKRLNIEGKEKDCYYLKVEIHYLRLRLMLYYIWCEKSFSYDRFLKFDKLARKYCDNYYDVHHENPEMLEDIVYNCLKSDPRESYECLAQLKKDIESGEFDRKIKEKLL